jgi:hypothetical protein
MADSWLDNFIGQRVTAVTGADNDRPETGELLALGEGWMQLAKDNGEVLLIPSTAIRIVKLLDMTRTVPAIDMTQPVYTPIAPLPPEEQNAEPSGF